VKRPRLALPYSILVAKDTVRLVAGEDFRYTLTAPGLDAWLPDVLRALDGVKELDALLPAARRDEARAVLERLEGERVIVDGPPRTEPASHGIELEGDAPRLAAAIGPSTRELARTERTLRVLVQDRLDLRAALAWNEARRRGVDPFLWATTGPLTRAYVSPVFLPGEGPCLACLLDHFERLSPSPEIHAALRAHEGALARADVPEDALAILGALVRWKVALLARPETPAAVYRLHVLEIASLEVSSHRVLVNPACRHDR
jgi:hypothetical protein